MCVASCDLKSHQITARHGIFSGRAVGSHGISAVEGLKYNLSRKHKAGEAEEARSAAAGEE